MAPEALNRVLGLDIFRAVSIIIIVLGHGKFLLAGTFFDTLPSIRLMDGVDLFFVLSGFLIGRILLTTIDQKGRFGYGELTHFWKRRWYRTLPNYYLILLANYLVVSWQLIDHDLSQFNFTFLIFLQNFSSPFYGFFWESWSLSVEEWFYIIAPCLLLLVLKLVSLRHGFLAVAGAMIVFSLCYRFFLYDETFDRYLWDITLRKTVLTRLDSIGYGLLAAWIFFYYRQMWHGLRRWLFFAGCTLYLIVLNIPEDYASYYWQVIYFSLSPLSAALLLPLAESVRAGHGWLARGITHISKISYSMYLVNLALVAEIIRCNFPPTSPANGLFKYLLYWLAVVGLSTILYRYFEKPIMDLRDKKLVFSKYRLRLKAS